MFLRRFSIGGDLELDFSTKKFEEMPSIEEKIMYLTQAVDNFRELFSGVDLTQKYKDKNNTIRDFVTVISNNYTLIMDQKIRDISYIISTSRKLIDYIPNSEHFVEMAEVLFNLANTDETNREVFIECLKSLFSETNFCCKFIESGLLLSMVVGYLKNKQYTEVFTFSGIVLTDAFKNTIEGEDPMITVHSNLVTFIAFLEDDPTINEPKFTTRMFLFFMSLIAASKNTDYIKSLIDDQTFHKINKLIYNFDPSQIFQLYGPIITLAPEYPMHPLILKVITEIATFEDVSSEFIGCFMDYLIFDYRFFEESFVGYLPINALFIPRVFKEEMLLDSYLSILKDVIKNGSLKLTNTFQKISKILTLPIEEGILIDQIFDFLIQTIENGLSPMIFSDKAFFRNVYIDPSPELVADFLAGNEKARTLFSLMFAEKRIGWHPTDLMTRVIELLTFDNHSELIDYFSDLVKTNFTPGMLRFFIETLDNENVSNLLYQTMSLGRIDLVSMFKATDCFSVVEKRISDPNYVVPFLTFVNTIVMHENDHFFDDWVITLPKDSPFFQLDSEKVAEFIQPQSPKTPIPIPSLVPLCNNFETDLYYNMYLLGAYAVPVYNKLGFPFDNIPNIKLVTNRFVRPEDLETLIDTNVEYVAQLMMTPTDTFPLFEFFPMHGSAWLAVNGGLPSQAFAFSIRFNEPCVVSYPFIQFNGTNVSYLNESLIAPDGTPVGRMESGKWHEIIIIYDKQLSELAFFVDAKCMFSIPCEHGGVLVDTIGNRSEPAPSFHVRNNITVIQKSLSYESVSSYKMPPQGNVDVTPAGSCGLALYNSISIVYSDPQQQMLLFDKFEEAESIERKQQFITIITTIPDFCKVDPISFFGNFMHSLKASSSKLITGWTSDFALCLLATPQIQDRTKVLFNVFRDFEFWSVLGPSYLSEFVVSVNKWISKYPERIDFEELFRLNILRYIFYLVITARSPVAEDPLIRLYVTLLGRGSNKELKKTARLLKPANMWRFDIPSDANALEPLLLSFSTVSEKQSKFVSAIAQFEMEAKRTVFSTASLFELAIVTNKGCAVSILCAAFSRQPEHEFMERYMPLICGAVKRFPLEKALWNFFLGRLCDEKFDIDNFQKASIKRLIYIPAVFVMLIALYKEPTSEIHSCVSSIVIMLFKSQLSILLQSNFLPFLIDLMKGGHRELPPMRDQDLEFMAPRTKSIPKNEVPEIKKGIKELSGRWQQNLVELVNVHSLPEPFPDSFVDFVSEFLCQIVHEQADSLITKSPKAIAIIAQHANPEIAKQFFIRFMSAAGKVNKKTSTSIVDGLLRCRSRCPSIFEDNRITDASFQFIEQEKGRNEIFSKYMATAIKDTKDSQVSILISIVSPYIDKLDVGLCLSMLKGLIKRNIGSSFKVYDETMKRLQKLIKDNEQLQEIIYSSTNENLSESLNDIDEFSFRPQPESIEYSSDDLLKLSSDLFGSSARHSMRAWKGISKFYDTLNLYMKNQEQFLCHRFHRHVLQSQPKSYRMSPFVLPASAPCVLFPSVFPIYTPSDDPPAAVTPKCSLFDLQTDFETGIEVFEYLPQEMFRFSGLFHATPKAIVDLFKETYGEYTAATNAQLVRVETRLPSVVFSYSDHTVILVGSSVSDGLIKLEPINTAQYTTFLEGAFLNEYGEYTMFCGRIAIMLDARFILHIRPYLHCFTNAVEVFSAQAGNFVLELDANASSLQPVDNLGVPSIAESTLQWQKAEISDLQYLLRVNYHARRSFADLAAYPIVPRLVLDMGTDRMENCGFRDLSLPVPIAREPDVSKPYYLKRFNQQKFFFSENVSNPLNVATMHCRMLPFCRYQWYVNDGWDKGDRNFLSISFHMSITKKTMYEFTPELFTFPEVFANANKFVIKGGASFDIELPKWSSSITDFVERHREVMESSRTRMKLNKWIDLIFGINQRSHEAVNIFNPMSYYQEVQPEERPRRHQWAETCGQVPAAVFQSEHPGPESAPMVDFVKLSLQLNPPSSGGLKFSKNSCTLTDGAVTLLNDPLLLTAQHFSRSADGLLLAVTLSSDVRIYTCAPGVFELSSLYMRTPRMTVVHSAQLLAITACEDCIILWSVASASVTARIDFAHVQALTVDPVTSTLFAAKGSTVRQYTLCGTLVREFSVKGRATSLAVFGFGFSMFDRILTVGLSDGNVALYVFERGCGEAIAIREARMTKSPVTRIEVEQNSYNIKIFDDSISQ